MDKEQWEYHAQMRTAVSIGLGFFTALAGVMLPVSRVSMYGLDDVITAAIMGGLVGFFLGIIAGLLLAWLVRLSPAASAGRASLAGPQLVGETCVLCNKRIGSIIEGEFCAACGTPIHHQCVQAASERRNATGCSRCGCDPAAQVPPS